MISLGGDLGVCSESAGGRHMVGLCRPTRRASLCDDINDKSLGDAFVGLNACRVAQCTLLVPIHNSLPHLSHLNQNIVVQYP